jgi:hypothetical protein
VDLPGDDETAGLPEYTSLVTGAIGVRDDVVLVAQSLGGCTAPLAAARPGVRALVFVNAMIPVPGETPGAWWGNTGWEQARIDAALTAAASGCWPPGRPGCPARRFPALLRNVAGITGIGLLSAAVLGGALAWAGPMACLVLTETALAGNVTMPWVWPVRPAHDVGGALCAAAVFAAGALLVTVRCTRESVRD